MGRGPSSSQCCTPPTPASGGLLWGPSHCGFRHFNPFTTLYCVPTVCHRPASALSESRGREEPRPPYSDRTGFTRFSWPCTRLHAVPRVPESCRGPGHPVSGACRAPTPRGPFILFAECQPGSGDRRGASPHSLLSRVSTTPGAPREPPSLRLNPRRQGFL